MINNFLNLLFGTFIGTVSTLININASREMVNIVSLHLTIITACFGFISAGFTVVYLYWQIKKIKRDLKTPK